MALEEYSKPILNKEYLRVKLLESKYLLIWNGAGLHSLSG